MDYKSINRDVYDTYAETFEERTMEMTERMVPDLNKFVSSLNGFRVLDIGCGPGRDSGYLRNTGCVVTSLDFSKEMLRLCGNRNPRVVLGDLENLPFLDVKFDGVWAVTSLLHMPKAELPNVLENINGLLRTGGMFYISMKEGNS